LPSKAGRLAASAVVLGGGQGRRMGGNKLFLSVEGTFLLERILGRLSPLFEELVLAVGPDDEKPLRRLFGSLFDRHSLVVVVDAVPGRGPLEGLASAFRAVTKDWIFAVGCDMPWVQEAVVRAQWSFREPESQVLCARLGGYFEPLHAFYRRDCLNAVEAALERGQRQIKAFYDDVNVTVVDEERLRALPGYGRSFRGFNTPEELAGWLLER
jgi:molybdopterin-guanine dinucleotide biosynthesis protein A